MGAARCPGGGEQMIETRRVELTEHDAARRLGLQPGPHAMLAVSDTGTKTAVSWTLAA
jgi:hypothetical protein